MKAIALVVVRNGMAEVYAPENVDVRVVDLDSIRNGDDPEPLPQDIGFDDLVSEAGLEAGIHYYWEGRSHAQD